MSNSGVGHIVSGVPETAWPTVRFFGHRALIRGLTTSKSNVQHRKIIFVCQEQNTLYCNYSFFIVIPAKAGIGLSDGIVALKPDPGLRRGDDISY